MKKLKQIGIVLSMMLVLTGCGESKELKKAYEKMKMGKELTSYKVDYRLYGTYNNKNVNDIIRIQNNNGKAIVEDNLLETDDKTVQNTPKIDKKLYEKPEIYLEGLKNAKERNKKEEKIAENTYQVYDITVKKSVSKDIIKYTSVKDLEIKDDINGKVYVNKDGYVYRIIYELDMANKLYLNVSYFAFTKK